jgi:RNA polymerase sigma-70 factor (ECF subfamily)
MPAMPGDSQPDGSPARSAISLHVPVRAPDDLAVVQAVLDGDREAFRFIVERESAPVIRACARILGDVHEAEDVAQEAFVIAYRSIGTWRGDGAFGAWLSRIAVRIALRRLAKRRAVPWARPGRPLDGTGPEEDIRAGIGVEPEVLALRAERAASARRAVANLDEPYREVVVLRFFAERSLEEISAITGRPLGTVKTHLRRGLLRLRDAFPKGGVA